MKKILFLANIPSPYRVDFFEELGKFYQLTVTFGRKNAQNRDASWLQMHAYNFNMVYLKGKEYGDDSAVSFEIVKILKDGNFDLVIVGVYSEPTSIIAIEYMNIHKIPYIISMDGALCHKDKLITRLLKQHLFRRAICFMSPARECDTYIQNYNRNAKIFRYSFTSLKREDIQKKVLTKEEKADIRRKLGITCEQVVLSVGQFIPRKGMDVLLKASNYLNAGTGVYIVGGKPTQEYIDELKTLKNNNVYFVDFKSKNDLADYYKAADVFALATREDIWGLVINEAMAYALPVVTTNRCVAGMELVDEGKNGAVVPVDNPELLSYKINEILESKNLNYMQMYSLNKIRNYTIEEMTNQHRNIIDNILRGVY